MNLELPINVNNNLDAQMYTEFRVVRPINKKKTTVNANEKHLGRHILASLSHEVSYSYGLKSANSAWCS